MKNIFGSVFLFPTFDQSLHYNNTPTYR